MSSPCHTHPDLQDPYMGLTFTSSGWGRNNNGDLLRKEPPSLGPLLVLSNESFRHKKTQVRRAASETAGQLFRISHHLSAIIHRLGPTRSVFFTLCIWSCPLLTSTTPPSLTSGHLPQITPFCCHSPHG
jgi:hypothetical protein